MSEFELPIKKRYRSLFNMQQQGGLRSKVARVVLEPLKIVPSPTRSGAGSWKRSSSAFMVKTPCEESDNAHPFALTPKFGAPVEERANPGNMRQQTELGLTATRDVLERLQMVPSRKRSARASRKPRTRRLKVKTPAKGRAKYNTRKMSQERKLKKKTPDGKQRRSERVKAKKPACLCCKWK